VPYTRGEEVSRPFDDVLTEVADLADQGVREITLLGQNVNAYRGPMATAPSPISRRCSNTSAKSRRRAHPYTTSHPREMTPALIHAHGRLGKLAPQLHLPCNRAPTACSPR
jgi:tRNA-2-methylthio-N6-dimethylallyladenosine synthase